MTARILDTGTGSLRYDVFIRSDEERVVAVNIDLIAVLQERMPPFSTLLGIQLVSASTERVVAEMIVREDLCTTPAILHGGAIMAFADTLGACATVLNLQNGLGTTTIESKTNFFAPATVGTKVTGESTALHRGKRTMVWQTRITNESGRLIAMVTQTQMVLELRTPDQERTLHSSKLSPL